MTYFAKQILSKPKLLSQFLGLASIALLLIALQATPARAQCAVETACWTTTDGVSSHSTNSGNVGIGIPVPVEKLDLGGTLASGGGGNIILGTYFSSVSRYLGVGSGTAASFATNSGFSGIEFGPPQAAGEGYVAFHTHDSGVSSGERMRIDKSGNVGIGTNNPLTKLHVWGNVTVTAFGNEVGNITAAGTIEGSNVKARYQDVAEWVPASGQIPAGTVVVLDSTKSNHVIASTKAYDTRVAGVISAQPGIALGESGENKVLVATTGRVRVKVDATRSPIHVGDLLVTSDVPGLAMKSEPLNIGGVQMHRPGTLLGKALEQLERGSGTILVLLTLQ